MRRSALLTLLVVPLLALGMVGCGGGLALPWPATPEAPEEPPVEIDPPQVTEASVTPKELRFSGGEVTIAAAVQSEGTIESVEAAVEGPDWAHTVALPAAGDDYAGVFVAPPNEGDAAVIYTVTVTATDDGQRTSEPADAGQFSVLTADELPQPEIPPGW